ncbi:MAG: DUF262 domain-containing protein [Alphaproteobacteria bacterium GM7ARS4]|nr:DUF262 domain-containing protein [Alphaproteobacteria bacterium GM7ARS4]
MEQTITNHKYTIAGAFNNCFYVVPDYQREYVWTEEHVIQLLEDINEQMDSSSPEYFIGTVLVSPGEERGYYDVIDGQQRLTTTFLILLCLRVLCRDTKNGAAIDSLIVSHYTNPQGDTKIDLKLAPRYENAGDVIKKIVDVKGDPRAVRANIKSAGIQISESIKKILDAYDVIYRFLTDNYDDEDKLKRYWGHLSNNVVFIQISESLNRALKIFETINERGVGLNPMDLLKNLLFTRVSPKRFTDLRDEWKEVNRPLEELKEKPLRFLRYFLMANYVIKSERKDKWKDAIVREDSIYHWFSKKENADLTGHRENPFAFVRKIIDNVDRYAAFSRGYDNDKKSSLAVDSLRRLTGKSFRLHYIWLLAAANLPPSLFNQFVAQIESFLFFYLFTKSPTRDLERKFSLWADEVRDIADRENPEEQRQKLNTFVSERFAQHMAEKAPELQDALKRLTLDSMLKFHIKYLLARLTQHVDMAFKGQKDRGSLDPYFDLEIEHILPKNPENDLRSAWQKKHPDLDYDEYTNRLGNLTLLEKPLNIVAGNHPYERKVSEYAKSAHYLTGSLSGLKDAGNNTSISRINEKLSAFTKWDAEDIEKRQELLIALALDIWKTTEITA